MSRADPGAIDPQVAAPDQMVQRRRLGRELHEQRTWQVLLLGGASGMCRSHVSYRMAQHFGVGVTEIDDFQVIAERMISCEQYPILHLLQPTPSVFPRMAEAEKRAHSVEYATLISESLGSVIANDLEDGPPMVIESDFLPPAPAALSRSMEFRPTAGCERCSSLKATTCRQSKRGRGRPFSSRRCASSSSPPNKGLSTRWKCRKRIANCWP
jgi:hypothetical protein